MIRHASRAAVAAALLVLLAGFEKPASPYQAVELGNQAFRDGRYRDAADYYDAAAADLPGAPEIAFDQGTAYFKLHDLDKAEAAFLRALGSEDRGLARLAHFNIGNVHYQSSLNAMHTFRDAVTPIREAMRAYREALALDPGFADAMYNLELADKLHEELLKARMASIENPDAEERAASQMPEGKTGPESEDQRPDRREPDDEAAEQGEQSGSAQEGTQSMPADEDTVQSDPSGDQRELSADEAEELVEMVRSRNRAAEQMRQQWREARMRDAAIEKPW